MGSPWGAARASLLIRAALAAAALATAASLAACGAGGQSGPQPTAPPAPPAPAAKAFAPLAIKADAKAPNQAVILGTDERNGSTIVPIVNAPATGIVDALFVKLGGKGPATGGSSPVKLATAPNADGAVQVGVFEELAGGTGTQWRAGVWMAAFVAASTLGKDLTDFTFSAASGGYIDGASASGLMAGGFLAAMTGARIDPAATMTGTINPDGTIGPVAGIPEKLKAAIEKGKRRLGYPIGLRMARSAATGELVDLAQLAKAAGAEAIEIANVYDAYALLTGRRLPRPVPVAEAEMALDDATARALDGKYREWQQRLAGEWAALLQLQQGGNLPRLLIAMARHAQSRGEDAEALHRRGALAAAYAKALEAWVFAAAATATFDVLQKVQQGDVPAALAALDKLDQLDRATLELLRQLGATRPTTMGEHMLVLGALQSALRGWGFKAFAADEVRGARRYLERLAGRRREELAAPAAADQIVAAVAPAIVLIGRTHAETLQARERLEYEREQTIGYTCAPASVKRLATSFQSAAAAGMSYFDTLLVEPMAQSQGVSPDAARAQLAMTEPDYLVAYMLSNLARWEGMPQALKQEWGEASLPWSLLSLAAGELAYHVSAQLIAKHYSLEVRAGDLAGRGATVLHEQAFANMLETAERTARASARAARIATGAIPVQAKLAYQIASVKRAGGAGRPSDPIGEKLDALVAYWMSSAYSQTAVMLARN
jgi:hypothetical protein